MAKSGEVAKKESLESSTLMWYDPGMEIFDDGPKTKEDLREINDHVICHTDLNECIKNIQSIEEEMIFLITSGSQAGHLLPAVDKLEQVHSVFIYCMDLKKWTNLKDQYPKIVDVHNELHKLCASVRRQISLFYRQLQSFSVFDSDLKTMREISKQSGQFVWMQLLHRCIMNMPSNPDAKSQMIAFSRSYFQGNPKSLKLIDEFEREYRPEDIFRWYTRESFLYRSVNTALRSENLDQLEIFRFVISDLSKALAREHRKILSSNTEILVLYRGTVMSEKEYLNYRRNIGSLISTNGYLSTSRSKDEALRFCDERKAPRDQIRVLFEITCNVKEIGSSVIYGDIADHSQFKSEQEVLFDLNAAFRLHSTKKCDDLNVIKMSVSNEKEAIGQKYVSWIERQTEEKSAALAFGKLLCDLGRYKQAENYFNRLLKESNGEDRAWIEFNLGRTLYFQSEWQNAKKHYEHAYQRMMAAEPPRVKDSIHVINNLGGVYKHQGELDRAKEFYEKALKLREKYLGLDHVDVASSLVNIGDVLDHQQRYDDALRSYERALKIQKNAYPTGHIDTAGTLSNIGNIYLQKGDYARALDYYQQALAMREAVYPPGHHQIAANLNNIGIVLRKQKKYREALEQHQRALQMRRDFYKSGHSCIGDSLNNIGACYEDLNDRQKALSHYEEALRIHRKFYGPQNSVRLKTEENIRRVRGPR